MYFHNVVGTGSYTTSTTNMYNKDFTYRSPSCSPYPLQVMRRAWGRMHRAVTNANASDKSKMDALFKKKR